MAPVNTNLHYYYYYYYGASLGLRLGNDELRIAVGMRLGCPLDRPHKCICGTEVDELGHHGLSCRRSAGHHRRHALANEVIVRAIRSAGVRAELEPSRLLQGMGSDQIVPLWALGALGGILFGTLHAQILSHHPTSSFCPRLQHLRLRG